MNDQQQSRADALTDTFRGDNDCLIRNIKALLELDAEGALVPHGIGGFARAYLTAAAVRLAASPVSQPAAAPIVSAQADERATFDLTDAEWLDVFERVSTSIPNVFGSYMKVRAAFAREAIRLAAGARTTTPPAAEADAPAEARDETGADQ